MPVAIIPLHPPRSSILFLSFSAAIEVSCRSGHVARPDSNSLFRAQPIVDKEKRLMKYYATRKYMPAHAALPLIRTRENRPFQSQGARWTANAGDATLYRFNILFPPTGPPHGSSHLPSLRAISIPYLALFRFSTIRSYLMYDTPLRRRPNGTNARLVFGTDHSPLSLRICLCPGTSRSKRVYVVHTLFSERAIRIRAAHKENSP